jgi:type I restriction enzyme S subunit
MENNMTTTYKQTEIGTIPNDWIVKSLGEVADVVGGGTPSTSNPEFWNGDINWFTPTEIGKEKYISTSERKITNLGLQKSSAKLLPTGTILLTSRATIGDVSILQNNEASTNQGFQSLIAKKNTNNEFLYYKLLTIKDKIISLASGSTFLEISPSKLRAIQIPLPPTLAEQEAIAGVLSDMDALLAALDKLIAKKKQIKTGAMQKLLAPQKDWETKKLGEVCQIERGQMITSNQYVNGNIPVIAGGKAPAGFHNVSNRKTNTITVSASGANAGFIAFHTEPIFASDCSTISESQDYDVKFIFFLLQSRQEEIYKLQTGGAQPHIHPKDIEPLIFAIPKSKAKQERIASILSDMDAEIAALERKREKYRQIKAGAMQQLLTGKVRLLSTNQ